MQPPCARRAGAVVSLRERRTSGEAASGDSRRRRGLRCSIRLGVGCAMLALVADARGEAQTAMLTGTVTARFGGPPTRRRRSAPAGSQPARHGELGRRIQDRASCQRVGMRSSFGMSASRHSSTRSTSPMAPRSTASSSCVEAPTKLEEVQVKAPEKKVHLAGAPGLRGATKEQALVISSTKPRCARTTSAALSMCSRSHAGHQPIHGEVQRLDHERVPRLRDAKRGRNGAVPACSDDCTSTACQGLRLGEATSGADARLEPVQHARLRGRRVLRRRRVDSDRGSTQTSSGCGVLLLWTRER